jgi:ATP-binding cassette subfamily F protein uup
MEKFGFTAEQQYTPLSKLSGGEKRRLHLLAILFLNPNFLVLDEPTNDLDLQTLRTLEEFLLDYPGCILIVSHDRYFMDRMVDHLFVFEGEGIISDFPGNYTQYREEAAREASRKKEQNEKITVVTSPEESPKSDKQSVKKLSFKEKFELESLEKEMPALEKEKNSLEEKMTGQLSYEELQIAAERITELIRLLDEKETRWLELSEKTI